MVATCTVSSGAGQHRSLRCVVADVAATNKDLAMDWDLPAALYCDVDELRRRAAWPACVARFTVAGDNPSAFDVEAPEYASAPHALRLDWALDGCAGDLTVDVPFHVRYLTPGAAPRRAVAFDAPRVAVDGARAVAAPTAAEPVLEMTETMLPSAVPSSGRGPTQPLSDRSVGVNGRLPGPYEMCSRYPSTSPGHREAISILGTILYRPECCLRDGPKQPKIN